MQDITTTATDVTVDRSKAVMTIAWSDDHVSEFAFAYLRSICPCAYCDTTKHGGAPRATDELSPDRFTDIQVDDVQEVGRYALRFGWSDGHDSGIYSYEYLRSRCTCANCQKLFFQGV